MKNFIRFQSLAFILIAIGMNLQSCEKGDEDISHPNYPEESGPEGDTPNPDEDTSNPDGNGSGYYVLLSATEETRYPSGNTITKTRFSNPVYNVESWTGKTVLQSYDWLRDSRHYDYTYFVRDNHIVCSYGTGWLETKEYTLNSDKLIIQGECDGELFLYSFDSRHRLTTIKSSYGNDAQIEDLSYDSNYNLTEYRRKEENGDIFEEATIEYTTIPTKSMPWEFYDVLSDIQIDPYLLEQGFFGNTIPMYLIKRIVLNSFGSESEKTYEYTLDRNGYVIEMVERDYRVDETFVTTWNFEWKKVATPSYSNWLFTDVGSPYYRYLNEKHQ